MLASPHGRLSHIQSLKKRYGIIQSLFLFLYSIILKFIILKFFRRSLFFQKRLESSVNNHFAGQRLSAGIMAQRAAESFSVIFMWRQLGR